MMFREDESAAMSSSGSMLVSLPHSSRSSLMPFELP